jgi:hypothetical protein
MAREVKVAVVGDARQLQKELQKAERAVAGFGKNAKDSSEQLRNVFIGGAIALGAKQVIDSASQLQAAVGGTAAIFGSASVEVDNFAQAAAKTSGLSEKAARDLTSKLGASLQGAGLSAEEAAKQAIFLTKTGADLAATLGGSTEEAVSALGGALRGEFDPLERFGIALKANDINAKAVAMGLADSETEVSAYAKGQASLALITERAAFAQGTFVKESNTAEGAAKIAGATMEDTSAKIGKSFLPIYTKAAQIVATLADAFSKLPSPVQSGLLVLGAAAVVGPKIVQGLSSASIAIKAIPAQLDKMAMKLVDTKSAMSGFGTTAETAANQTTKASRAMRGLVGAAAVVTTVVIAYEQFQSAVNDAREAQDKMNESVASTAALSGMGYLQNELKKTHAANKELYDGLSIWDTLTRWDPWNALTEAGKMQSLDKLDGQLGVMTASAIALSDAFGLDQNAAAVWLGTMADSGVVFGSVAEAVNAYTGTLVINTSKTGAATKAQDDYAVSLKHANDVLKGTTDPIFAVMSAQDSLTEANAAYEKIKNDSTKTEAEKEAALRKTYTAAWDLTSAQTDLGIALANGDVNSAKMQAALDTLRLQGIDPSTEAGQKLIEKMYGTSDTAAIVSALLKQRILRAETDDSNLDALLGKLDLIRNLRNEIFFPELGTPGKGLGFVRPRALGGPVGGNNPYLVGERGPELFVPSTAGRIMTNAETARMSATGVSGSVTNVTINLPPGVNGDDVVDAIRRYERRNGPIFQAA